MLIDVNQASLLLVDVQEKLTPLVNNAESLVKNCSWLCELAYELHIPVVVSEHYPQGLSHTVPELRRVTSNAEYQEKVHFSCASDDKCMQMINRLNREQIIIIGIETHVCVLQTAIELHLAGKQVFVVADAVSSRASSDHDQGLARMRSVGLQIITKEMVLFEGLRRAATEQFKAISQKFLK